MQGTMPDARMARKTTHGLGGQQQFVDRTVRGKVSQNDTQDRDKWRKYRFMVWPTLGSRTAKKQNRIQGMRNRLVRRRAEFHSVNLQFTGNFVIASINAKLKLK